MASLYTYRPQTFGLVFVIASVPSGKMKYTSPEYLHKAEVQNVTHCDSMVETKGRGWSCSQAARGISQALHPSRSGHWRKIQSETASGSQQLSECSLLRNHATTSLHFPMDLVVFGIDLEEKKKLCLPNLVCSLYRLLREAALNTLTEISFLSADTYCSPQGHI